MSATVAARAAARRRAGRDTGSARTNQRHAPARMKLRAVAGFMATPPGNPRFSGSTPSHHPRRAAAPIKMTAALAVWATDRSVTLRRAVESPLTCHDSMARRGNNGDRLLAHPGFVRTLLRVAVGKNTRPLARTLVT